MKDDQKYILSLQSESSLLNIQVNNCYGRPYHDSIFDIFPDVQNFLLLFPALKEGCY